MYSGQPTLATNRACARNKAIIHQTFTFTRAAAFTANFLRERNKKAQEKKKKIMEGKIMKKHAKLSCAPTGRLEKDEKTFVSECETLLTQSTN